MTVPTTPTSSLPAVGIPGPDSTASNAEFWSWLRRHELRVQACTSCGLTRTPAAEVCHGCYELGSEWIPLKPVGRIFSWTRVWHGASDDLAGHTPYVVVMVEIDAHPDLPPGSWQPHRRPARARWHR